MTQDELKTLVGQAALQYVKPDSIVGVGTGSTVDKFIDALAASGIPLKGAVSSSVRSTERMSKLGIRILEASEVESLPVYIDGADEINGFLQMIKGGGGALTREKIVAAVAEKFVCIADQSKKVRQLGEFPLPVEVIPMARSHVARELVKLGGRPVLREGVTTDNGNIILDVWGLAIAEPIKLETEINQIVGVVCNGLFARRPADVLLLGTASGVETQSAGA